MDADYSKLRLKGLKRSSERYGLLDVDRRHPIDGAAPPMELIPRSFNILNRVDSTAV
jgi:hypothetical protein